MSPKGQGYFVLDSTDFSFFPKEKEILLCDGLEFKIDKIIPDLKFEE